MATASGWVVTRFAKAVVGVPLLAALTCIAGGARADNMQDAMRFYESGHYVHAVDRFRAAAMAGNAQAQEILGFMYALGSDVYPGVPRDVKAASHWLDLAARKGRPVSRYVACAMRYAAMSAKMRSRSCFDWVVEVGRPGPR